MTASAYGSFSTPSWGKYNAGDVIISEKLQGFDTSLILGFTDDGEYVKLIRPYAYATCVGTTYPHALLGWEEYVARVESLSCDRHIPSHYTTR